MIKRTLYFGNPSYLSISNAQLVIRLPEVESNAELPTDFKKEALAKVPVEDIGIIILDNQQITISNALLQALQENNVSVMVCDSRHMPQSLLLPIEGNNIQQERHEIQMEASEPLKKSLWAQTVVQKIKNQASILDYLNLESNYLIPIYKNIKSGDSGNGEAIAANYYWQTLFAHIENFTRFREGSSPNHWLNYGYAILRATMARSIVGAGLIPTLGIFHKNKYNAYCLADDLMEPYRPFVDLLVHEMVNEYGAVQELNKEQKSKLLKIPVLDVNIDGETSPLMVATQRTSISLVKCFAGTQRKLIFPELQ